MSTQAELTQRWDTFLNKMETRFNESLTHAEEACSEQLLDTDYDYETVFRSWQGIKSQINALIKKIDEVWYGKVQPEMEAVGDFYHEEGDKAYDLNHKLFAKLEAFERSLEGKLSQEFYDHAIQIANKKASCSQCGGDLVIRKDIFRSQYITCTYCNTVNTIEPETKFMKIGWGIIDNIATKKAQKEYVTMQDDAEAIREYRGQAPQEYWTRYENSYFTYWEKFFNERISLSSDKAERFEDDMERKRVEFENYKQIQTS